MKMAARSKTLGELSDPNTRAPSSMRYLIASAAFVTFIVCFQAAVTIGITVASLNYDKSRTTSGGEVAMAMDGQIAGTRVAKQTMSLAVAPAMTQERLSQVSSLSVTFLQPPPDLWPTVTSLGAFGVTRSYMVTSATKVSREEVVFGTATEGHQVRVRQGTITVVSIVVDADGNRSVQWSAEVCNANLACAALVIDTQEEIDGYLAAVGTSQMVSQQCTTCLSSSGCSSCGNADFDAAYAECAAADQATDAADAASPCVEGVVTALGEQGIFTASGLPFTCAAFAALLPPVDYDMTEMCEWDKMSVLCPATCGATGRRAAEEFSEAFGHAFGHAEADHPWARQQRRLDKCQEG